MPLLHISTASSSSNFAPTRRPTDLCKESMTELRKELDYLKVRRSASLPVSLYGATLPSSSVYKFIALQATEWMFDDKKMAP